MVRPKWSLDCVREIHAIGRNSVEVLIHDLNQFPQDAWVTSNDYELEVSWMRDMTAKEFEKEKLARKEKRLAIQVGKRSQLEKLAKELGIEISDG